MTDEDEDEDEDEELSDVGWGLIGGLAFAAWAALQKKSRDATEER